MPTRPTLTSKFLAPALIGAIVALGALAGLPVGTAAVAKADLRARPVAAHHVVRAHHAVPASTRRLGAKGAGRVSAVPPSASGNTIGGAWTAQGPRPISGIFGDAPTGGSSGRITGLAVVPGTAGQTVFAGTAGGGVWESTDGGANWTPKTDTQATLAIGAIAVSSDGQTILAGTGEANSCGDCQIGSGILKSTDGGSNWTLDPASAGCVFPSIAIDRTNSSNLMAAFACGNTSGAQYSTDAGISWHTVSGLTGRPDVIAQDPGSPAVWYLAASSQCGTGNDSIYAANNPWIGSAFTAIAGFPVHPSYRLGMGAGPNGTLFVAVAHCNAGDPNASGALQEIDSYVSGTWTARTVPSTAGAYNTCPSNGKTSGPLCDAFSFAGGGGSQGWYDNVVGADPNNASRVVVAGIDAIASLDGGATWTDIDQPYSGGVVHSDNHAISFWESSAGVTGGFFLGNDGGIWSTTSAHFGGAVTHLGGDASEWTDRNNTLAITQLYAGAAASPTTFFGGAQDNGTFGTWPVGSSQVGAPPSLEEACGGDGGFTGLDAPNKKLYCEYAGGYLSITSYATGTPPNPVDLGYNSAIGSEPTAFITPFAMDPHSASTLYTGAARIWRLTNAETSPTWAPIHPDITTGTLIFNGGDAVAAVTTVANGSGTALAEASAAGNLWYSPDVTAGSPHWYQLGGYQAGTVTPITTSNLPTSSAQSYNDWIPNEPWIESIAINPTNPDELWVALGTNQNPTARIFHTTNASAANVNWVAQDALPNGLIATALTFDAANGDLIAGTSGGVYACMTCLGTGAQSWARLGTGMPNVRVDQVGLSQDASTLFAYTHGRGIQTIPPPSSGPPPPPADFTLSAAPASLSVAQGAYGTFAVTINRTGTPNQSVTLSTNGLPTGVNAAITPSQTTGTSASLVLQVGPSAAIGSHAFTIVGTAAGPITHNTGVTLNVTAPPRGPYNALPNPVRILDTRGAVGGHHHQFGPGESFTVSVAGFNNGTDPAIPTSGMGAVVLNVTIVSASTGSFLTVFPSGGGPMPTASNINFGPGQALANLATINLGSDGNVVVHNDSGTVDVILDMQGYFADTTTSNHAGLYNPLPNAVRLLDTRFDHNLHRLQQSSSLTLPVRGVSGIPANAAAVTFNLTAVCSSTSSYLAVLPQDTPQTVDAPFSNLNFPYCVNTPNRVISKLSPSGAVTIYNSAGSVDVIVDVTGWFTDASSPSAPGYNFTAISPLRLLDTRDVGQTHWFGPMANAGVTIPYSTAVAVVVNVTGVAPTTGTYLTVYPDNAASPPKDTSDLNINAGGVVANMCIPSVANNHMINVWNNDGQINVVVDLAGYFD